MTADIEKTYEIPFAPYRVYNAWVSNDAIIAPATRMDILPELGGHYRLFVEGKGEDFSVEGIFTKIKQNRFLEYSWVWSDNKHDTTVSVAFSPAPDGTKITLRHSGFQLEESRANHDTGWDEYIVGLTKYLAGFNSSVTH